MLKIQSKYILVQKKSNLKKNYIILITDTFKFILLEKSKFYIYTKS